MTENSVRECVGAIIVRDDLILLGKRSDERSFYPRVWDVFGGHVEPRESLSQTLRRELREELGIAPTAWRHLETARGADPVGQQVVCHFFAVTKWRGTPENKQPHEHSEVRWFRVEEVSLLDLAHPDYLRMFAAIFS